MSKCNICIKNSIAFGYCSTHLWRYIETGNKNCKTNSTRRAIKDGDTRKIPLGDNRLDFAIVDLDREYIGDMPRHISNGYAISNGKRMHHLIIGYPPKGQLVDHINRNRLDNRLCNLRFANNAVNAINSGMRIDNKSGYKGVIVTKANTYNAYIISSGKKKNLGTYKTIEEAIQARKDGELKYRSHHDL